jgi:uncharacterized membrane protein
VQFAGRHRRERINLMAGQKARGTAGRGTQRGADGRGGADIKRGAGGQRGSGGQRGAGGQRGGKARGTAVAGAGQRGGTAARPGNGRGPARPAGKAAAARRADPAERAAASAAEQAAGGDDAPRGVVAQFRSMGWLPLTALVLSLIGLGLSVFLTIEHLQGASHQFAGCSDNSVVSCQTVTNSAESKLFGIFPVAELGLLFYLVMVAINSPWAWRSRLRQVAWVRLGSIVAGMAFVLYLLYAELFEIGKICLYCTGVHVVTLLLFALIVSRATMPSSPSASPVSVPAGRR